MDQLLERLDGFGIAAALLGADRLIATANGGFARRLGLPAQALVGRCVDDVLAEAALPEAGAASAGTYRFERGDETTWLRLDIRAHDGVLLAWLAEVSAERKTIENIAYHYRTRDRLLRDSKIGTWRYDPDAEVYYFSSELALGHDRAAAPVPVAMLQLIQHAADRDADTAIRERITREGGFADAEMRYREADGSWTHLHVHYRAGRRLPSGRYEMLGISQNITPVASARDQANAASQRLTLALRAAHAGVFEYDFARRKFWLSQELKDLLGREALERLKADPLALYKERDAALAQSVFERAVRGGETAAADIRAGLDGREHWVRFYFSVTDWEPDRRPRRGVGLLLDIDEQKRQEMALTEARRAAEFANRTKTEFLANMSHELRTPLNAILGFSEVIETQLFGPVNARYAGYAHDIHKSGEHLLALVNDVLDLAKLEAGKLELREADIPVPAIVGDCLALLRGKADAGGVRLSTELGDLTLRADPRAVKQLLLNFLSNAIKFTPEGGTVAVRAARNAAGGIELSVSDTGIGMSEAEIKVALSPFGQIDSKLARKHTGTGLGLPICISLMELHGGELAVTSEPDRGTTLTARFPPERTICEPQAARA